MSNVDVIAVDLVVCAEVDMFLFFVVNVKLLMYM